MSEPQPLGPLLRRPEVERQTGLSRATIYRQIREGVFPKPRRIGRQAVAWPAAEIEKWKREQPEADCSNLR